MEEDRWLTFSLKIGLIADKAYRTGNWLVEEYNTMVHAYNIFHNLIEHLANKGSETHLEIAREYVLSIAKVKAILRKAREYKQATGKYELDSFQASMLVGGMLHLCGILKQVALPTALRAEAASLASGRNTFERLETIMVTL